MYIFRLLFLLSIISIISISAMDQQSATFSVPSLETLSILMESLKLHSLADQATQELTLLLHTMNLRKNCASKFEKISDLAMALNVCLIKDESYFTIKESIAMEHFHRNKGTSVNSNKELSLMTRELLKYIVRLTKNPIPEYSLLEQAIYQIPSYNLKYLLNTQGFPYIFEDTTTRYKQEMLAALHN